MACLVEMVEKTNQPWKSWTEAPKGGGDENSLNFFLLGQNKGTQNRMKTSLSILLGLWEKKKWKIQQALICKQNLITDIKVCSVSGSDRPLSVYSSSCGWICSSINSTRSPRSRLPVYSVTFCPFLKRINVG